jgi:hypothetical protein
MHLTRLHHISFSHPIDDKTILTASCLIRLFLERREPRIGLVVE